MRVQAQIIILFVEISPVTNVLLTLGVLLACWSRHGLRHGAADLWGLCTGCFASFCCLLGIIGFIFLLRLKREHVLFSTGIFYGLGAGCTEWGSHRFALCWRLRFWREHEVIGSWISRIIGLNRHPNIDGRKHILIVMPSGLRFSGQRLWSSRLICRAISSRCWCVPWLRLARLTQEIQPRRNILLKEVVLHAVVWRGWRALQLARPVLHYDDPSKVRI